MRRNRIIPVLTVAATVTAAATACASSGTTGAPGSAGDGSGQAMTLLAKMAAPQAVAASTKAVASKQSVRVHMTMHTPQLTESADGAASFGRTTAVEMTVMMSPNAQAGAQTSQVGRMEMRMTGLVAYLDMGDNPKAMQALQGKRWVKVDFSDLSDIPQLAEFAFLKDALKNNDPGMKLKSLLASPDLRKVGQEVHNGVQTLHFSGAVSTQDMLKATTAGTGLTQQDLDALTAAMKQAGVTHTGYELWVDGNGLPVEVQSSQDTAFGTISGDVSYSDWGTPVNVTAPPADQTADVVQLLKQQNQQQS